jgi:soluble lytic murein transglycosylase-like protein
MSELLGRWSALVLVGLLMTPLLSRAQGPELYGYVDGLGVAHFANEALDSRYSPVLRQPGDEVGRVPGKTMVRSSLLTWLEFAPEVKAMQGVLRDAERATGVDMELLQAMIAVESGFKPDLVSPKGAIGLMQITPDTGNRYATKAEAAAQPVAQRLRDPRLNVMTGARMLADLTRRFGAVDAAIAAWNAGEGRVRRAGGKVPNIAETQAHVQLVLELYWSLLQQRQHRLATTLNVVSNDLATPLSLR